MQRLQSLGEAMSYEKACEILKEWGVDLSSSFIAKTSETFEATQQELSETVLLEAQTKPLSHNKIPPRVWMILDHIHAPDGHGR